LPEWKETMDSWGSKMISAIEVHICLSTSLNKSMFSAFYAHSTVPLYHT